MFTFAGNEDEDEGDSGLEATYTVRVEGGRMVTMTGDPADLDKIVEILQEHGKREKVAAANTPTTVGMRYTILFSQDWGPALRMAIDEAEDGDAIILASDDRVELAKLVMGYRYPSKRVVVRVATKEELIEARESAIRGRKAEEVSYLDLLIAAAGVITFRGYRPGLNRPKAR